MTDGELCETSPPTANSSSSSNQSTVQRLKQPNSKKRRLQDMADSDAPYLDEYGFQPDFNLQNTEDVMNISAQQASQPVTIGHCTPTSLNNGVSSQDDRGSISPKRKSTSTGRKGCCKKIGKDSLDNFTAAIRERNALIASIIGGGGAGQSFENTANTADAEVIPNLAECIRDLKDLPDLPYHVYLKAMNLFTEPKLRSLFSVMPREDKVEWLRMMTNERP